jgi:competence protein ComGC
MTRRLLRRLAALTLAEVVVTLGVLAVVALVVLPLVMTRLMEESHRKGCMRNMDLIVRAATTYQEPSGDFFPAQTQYAAGTTAHYSPMPSLALLYPAYIEPRAFGCPATRDRPVISERKVDGARWLCFGTDDPERRAPAANPVLYSGRELSTNMKSSYYYDEFQHFRDVGPSQAIFADADGQTWRNALGDRPPYPAAWTRVPRKPNHRNGQHVTYFDGHVKWTETVYASDEPTDNIFCPTGGASPGSGQWGADTDAYLWDGVNARAKQLD